jgi:hypothetical protein
MLLLHPKQLRPYLRVYLINGDHSSCRSYGNLLPGQLIPGQIVHGWSGHLTLVSPPGSYNSSFEEHTFIRWLWINLNDLEV